MFLLSAKFFEINSNAFGDKGLTAFRPLRIQRIGKRSDLRNATA